MSYPESSNTLTLEFPQWAQITSETVPQAFIHELSGISLNGATALDLPIFKDKIANLPEYFNVYPSSDQLSEWIEINEISEDLKFYFPLSIQIEKEKDYFIAGCPMLNLYIDSESRDGAVEMIKEVIANDYQCLLDDYPDQLTQDAIDLLRLYRSLLRLNLP
jgi:hypothetical protein